MAFNIDHCLSGASSEKWRARDMAFSCASIGQPGRSHWWYQYYKLDITFRYYQLIISSVLDKVKCRHLLKSGLPFPQKFKSSAVRRKFCSIFTCEVKACVTGEYMEAEKKGWSWLLSNGTGHLSKMNNSLSKVEMGAGYIPMWLWWSGCCNLYWMPVR